jgi:hypothetical protein
MTLNDFFIIPSGVPTPPAAMGELAARLLHVLFYQNDGRIVDSVLLAALATEVLAAQTGMPVGPATILAGDTTAYLLEHSGLVEATETSFKPCDCGKCFRELTLTDKGNMFLSFAGSVEK